MHAPFESHGPLDKVAESAGPALRELAEAVGQATPGQAKNERSGLSACR